jgi:hypothetical protein
VSGLRQPNVIHDCIVLGADGQSNMIESKAVIPEASNCVLPPEPESCREQRMTTEASELVNSD